jgi:phage terminase large subunit
MIEINEKFKPLYEESANLYIITGERGSAKSFTVSDYLARKTFQKNQVIYFTRYTLTDAKDSVIPEFNEKIDMLNAVDFFEVNRLDITNKLSKSEIKFRGLKPSQGSQTAKVKSLTGATVWVIDEGEEMTDIDLFHKLDASLRKKDQKNIKIIIMNPTYKKHWVYKTYFRDRGVPENSNIIKDNVCYIHMTWEDNRENLSEQWVKEAEKMRKENPVMYKRKYTTGWLNPDEGLLFPELITFKDIDFTKENTRIAYIDTADEGSDFYAMPIVEIIGDKAYLIDVIFNKARLTANEPLTVAKINDLHIDRVIVETNKEGSLYIGNLIKQTKSTIIGIKNTTKKETRILTQSSYILDKLRIKEPEYQSKEYASFIENTLEYEIDSKEKQHDDAPDSLAGLFKYLRVYLRL